MVAGGQMVAGGAVICERGTPAHRAFAKDGDFAPAGGTDSPCFGQDPPRSSRRL
jgi:hypothetical protein